MFSWDRAASKAGIPLGDPFAHHEGVAQRDAGLRGRSVPGEHLEARRLCPFTLGCGGQVSRPHCRPTAACIALVMACLLASGVHAASLTDLRERGWLRVCAHPDALPFSSQDRNQPGFQLEIADAIAKILGVRVIPEWIVFTRHARRAECDAVIGGVVPLTGEQKGPRRGVLLTKP